MPQLIYINGVKNTRKDAEETAHHLARTYQVPVHTLHNNTEGLGGDIAEYIQGNYQVQDVLNAKQIHDIQKTDQTLIVAHSAGNRDLEKALDINNRLGNRLDNLSILSIGSPVPKKRLEQAAEGTKVQQTEQVNDWRDPVTWHPAVQGTAVVAPAVAGAVGASTLIPALPAATPWIAKIGVGAGVAGIGAGVPKCRG